MTSANTQKSKSLIFERPLHVSEDLRKGLRKGLLWTAPVIVIANLLLFLGWWLGGYVAKISLTTQQYVYSSLIQGFAAMAGLLLTLLAFLYQRIRDSQDGFLEDAARGRTFGRNAGHLDFRRCRFRCQIGQC